MPNTRKHKAKQTSLKVRLTKIAKGENSAKNGEENEQKDI